MEVIDKTILSLQNRINESRNKGGIAVPVALSTLRDALALLKEQEVQKFFVDESEKITPLPVVVRCKDCKYHFVDGDNVRFNMCLLNHNQVQTDDWFCADWERKAGETDE